MTDWWSGTPDSALSPDDKLEKEWVLKTREIERAQQRHWARMAELGALPVQQTTSEFRPKEGASTEEQEEVRRANHELQKLSCEQTMAHMHYYANKSYMPPMLKRMHQHTHDRAKERLEALRLTERVGSLTL
jgi:hypothetical protein